MNHNNSIVIFFHHPDKKKGRQGPFFSRSPDSSNEHETDKGQPCGDQGIGQLNQGMADQVAPRSVDGCQKPHLSGELATQATSTP
jgi:hypothetical protein